MLIFFDIDGTLIDEKEYMIPDSARDAIARARENGHLCMINTGRTKRLVGKDITGPAEFDGLLLGCGTMITYHGETLFHKTFSREQSVRIQEGLRRHGIDALLEGCDNDYLEPVDRMVHTHFKKYAEKYDGFSFGSWEDAVGHFDKLFVYSEDRCRMDAFAGEFSGELDFIYRRRGFFELIPKGYSKASAMDYIAGILHIPMEETVAIGDSSNDVAMLKRAGRSIAMGNGTDEVKDLADYVTTAVEDDGIWNALNWLGVL